MGRDINGMVGGKPEALQQRYPQRKKKIIVSLGQKRMLKIAIFK